MLKFCYEHWDKNKSTLEQRLRTCGRLSRCYYKDLLQMTVECVLNNNDLGYKWDVMIF